METISDATLRALNFYHFLLDYLEKGAPWFVDVTDEPELAIEPEDDGQPITDSEDEKMRKGLKRTAKRKAWRNNLYASIR